MMTSNLKTLNEHIKTLQKLVEKDPTLGELPCIYFSDEEGNNWEYLRNNPCVATIHNSVGVDTGVRNEIANAICIN
jgi:hypothetical protein